MPEEEGMFFLHHGYSGPCPKPIIKTGPIKPLPTIETIAEVLTKQEIESLKKTIAKALHYPECWDTMAYPSLESAITESIGPFQCQTCKAGG